MKKEIEVKIELTKEEFRNCTRNIGEFNMERTYGYFTSDFSNIKEGIFPRIKHIVGEKKEIILSVKRKNNNNINFFEREEIEIKVRDEGNINTARELIKSLGFSKEIVFEKRRKNIFKNDINISFDELPFGFFVEFEGDPKKIEYYLNEYNLSKRPKITRAYLSLWTDYKKAHGITEVNCEFK